MHKKYDRPVASMNPPLRLRFVAIAFYEFGGIGFEFYSTVVKPYFEKLREKEEEAGGSGWDARTGKKKSGFLQSLSITIAKKIFKGNYRVLDCMRRDWQSATAPDLPVVTSSSVSLGQYYSTVRAIHSPRVYIKIIVSLGCSPPRGVHCTPL